MIMKILGFDMEIDINNEKTNILLISDSKLFGRICFDLTRNNDENIVFVLDNKIVNMKDILIISDIMNFDINNKMIISKLYNQMSNSLLSDSDIENEIKKHYIEIVKKVYYDCLVNKIIDLLEIYSELCNQTIVFINTLNYFSNEEINEVLKYIDYKKISVLFLENSYNKDVYFENKYIIDDEFYDYIVHNNKK